MTPGWAFAGFFAGMLLFLAGCIGLAVCLARWMDKRDKARHRHYGKEVEESETPAPNKLEPESTKQFKDRWGIGGK